MTNTLTETIDRFDGEYRFLSNFWKSPMVVDGEKYATNEHYYQSQKAAQEKDRLFVIHAPTPASSKRRGQQIEIRKDWDDVRVAVMLKGLRAKFEDPGLRQKLLDTGDAELIEGNTWNDRFWGVCQGKGRNHLGLLLMQVRDECK